MYPANVKFVTSSDGLIDDDKHTVVVVNAVTPLDATVDRDLILTLSTHYDTVTVVLKTEKKKPIVFKDDARPTCEDGDCTCESCASQRHWDEHYDSNTGTMK